MSLCSSKFRINCLTRHAYFSSYIFHTQVPYMHSAFHIWGSDLPHPHLPPPPSGHQVILKIAYRVIRSHISFAVAGHFKKDFRSLLLIRIYLNHFYVLDRQIVISARYKNLALFHPMAQLRSIWQHSLHPKRPKEPLKAGDHFRQMSVCAALRHSEGS